MPTGTEIRQKATTGTSGKKDLIYPSKMRDLINVSNPEEYESSVAFVLFTPLNEKVIVPPLEDILETDATELSNESKNKIKYKYKKTGVNSIILPIRPNKDSITANWQSVEGMGLGNFKRYFKWKAYKALSGIASQILPQEAVYAMKSGAFGGGIDNPHDKLAFAGHNRRSFDLSWSFMKPQNKEDAEILNDIISIFRMSSVGGYGDWVITPPPTWKIEYYSLPSYPKYLRYARCGIEASVEFGGTGNEFKAMEDGMPFMSLSLQCSNLNYDSSKDLWIKPSSASLITSAEEALSVKDKEKMSDAKKYLIGKEVKGN